MAPVVAPVFTWTGCYIGGNAGGKWIAHRETSVTVGSSTFVFDNNDNSGNGAFTGGGQVGCNYQTGQFVFGIEGDFDYFHRSESFTVGPFSPLGILVPGDNFSATSRWEASLRARLGYAWDRTLLYVTGGVAWTNVRFDANFVPTTCGTLRPVTCPGLSVEDSQTFTGGTVGAGIEYAITNNLIGGIEGRYTWYGDKTFNAGALAVAPGTGGVFVTSPASANFKFNTAEVLGRLSWKFDWGSPVVARY
jgi:outer membrane immunogenic protein